MGGKTTTSTNQVTIPQDVLDRYNAVNTQAAKVAENPFQKYGTTAEDFVAQFNNQQLAGVSDINAASGAYKPYMTEATSATQSGISSINDVIGDYKPYMTEARSATRSGMGPAYEGIDNYMSPYIKDVADTTRAQMEQAQEQAQSGALGTAVSSGAFGGDRAGVAAANLANQQNLAMGSTMANIYNQGYTQALGASQADLARQLQGGSQIASIGAQSQQLGLQGAQAQLAAGTQMADLGARAQQLGLQGGQAQLAAGTQMQQTEQAGKDALINQFMQEQGYPFQVAQFLANIAMGTGALSGSTTTTTQPAQILSDRRLKHDIKKIGEADNGLPIYTFKYKGDDHHQTHVGFMADEVERKNPDAVGLDPSGYKTVDYDKAAQSMGGGVHPHHKGEAFADGGVAGPYGSKVGQGVGVGSYVPQAFLPVGELMVADPAVAAQHKSGIADALESAASMGKSVVEIRDLLKKEARGGVVGGYADGGGVVPKLHGDYLSSTLAAQEAGKDKPELMTAKPAEKQESALGNIASTLGSIATIAKIIPFSDRRLKHDIKRIGKTEKGLPIYTFKYKGDDREQTHVGFMADEVERDHPEAVGKRDGYKTVDYSQAHKFADGGVAGRHGYALDGAVEERLRDAMRKAAAAENDMRMARDEGAARDVDNSYRKMPAIFSDEATRIMADREGKGLGEYLSSLGQEAMSAKFADAERRAANQITSSNSVFNENLPVRGTQTGSNDISSKFDRVRDEALLGLGANASQAFTDADYYGLGADQGMPDLLTARETFNQENPQSQMRGPNDFRATPARPSIFDEISGTIGDIAQNYREAALREARKASMGSTASMPPPEMTGPEWLASFRLNERVPAGMASVINTAVAPFAGAAGLGLGLVGASDAGNAAMDFARQRLVDATDFADVALSTDEKAQEIYRRRAAENFVAENDAANQAIAEAPLTVDQRPRPRPVEGGVAAGVPTDAYKQMASTMREAGISNLAGDKLIPTGVVPADGQMRPRPRPEGLGAAAAPVVAPVVPAKPAADTRRKIASVIGSGDGFTDVEYTDGTKERITGDRNFRNNNPGNMEYGDLAKKYGAVGRDGRFAVFPDYETGRRAKEALLFESGVYDGRTIITAIEKYAPLGDGNNNPEEYAKNVAAALGVSVNTPLSSLTPGQRSAMLTAMEKEEGSGSGVSTYSTTPLGADGSPVPLRGGVAGGAGNEGVAGGAGSQGRRGGVKPYDERNTLGKMMYDEDGRINKNALLSLLAGFGDMVSSPSPFLLPAIGAGVAGAARTYMAREEQVADIAKTNVENLNKLYDLYNNFIATEPEYAWMTLEEFAKKNNLGHLLPKGSPIPNGAEASPTSSDRMTVQEYRNGFVDMGGRKVAMSNDPASIQKFINDNAGFSPETYIGRQVAEARAQLLRLDQSGFTIDAETGQPFAMPGPITAGDEVARAEANRIASGEFRGQAPEVITAANRQTLLSNELAKVFVRAESGTLAEPGAQLQGLLKALDPQNTFGWTDNFEVGKEDYDSAAKLAGEIIASRLQSLPGGAPASTIDLVSTVVPNLGIQPEAAKKLIAMQLAEARYTAELYGGYNPDPDVHGTDINAYGKQFAAGDRFKKYYEEALESLPLFAGEVPPGIDPNVWILMDKTEKKEAQNSYNLERGGLNGN